MTHIADPGSDLGLAGLPNARDLGGHRTRSGAVVRRGVLFRADAPVKATEADLSVLRGLGIVQVIDLRGESEIEAFGLGTWDAPRIHLPIADVGRGILAQLAEAAKAGSADASAVRQMMTESYRHFVADRQARDQFAAAARLIASPGGVPALFHCTAGKDRTGWLAAVILTVLGVGQRAVVADYMMTNTCFTTGRGTAGRQKLLTSLRSFADDVQLLLPVLNADPAYLAAAFDEARRIYGTFDAFLRDGLHLDVERLRKNLLSLHMWRHLARARETRDQAAEGRNHGPVLDKEPSGTSAGGAGTLRRRSANRARDRRRGLRLRTGQDAASPAGRRRCWRPGGSPTTRNVPAGR